MAAPTRLFIQGSYTLFSCSVSTVNVCKEQLSFRLRYLRQFNFRWCGNTTHSQTKSNIRLATMQLTTWTWSSHHQHGQSYGRRPRQGLCADVRSLSTTCKTAQLMFFKRWMTTGLTDDMLRKEMDKLTDKFMEAKELLDDARDSMGSVYFNEDLQDADRAVEETLAEYKHLLSQLDEAQRQTVTRSIGLRMEELAAQQKMIRETLGD